jgi:hypothetical protein
MISEQLMRRVFEPREGYHSPADDVRLVRTPVDNPSTISKLNIKRCWRLLAAETDPAKRATITKLLAEEEAKLREIERSGERL